MEIQLDSNQTIHIFQEIIDFVENNHSIAPDNGQIYYICLLQALAQKNSNEDLKTHELLAMFYCYVKIRELAQSNQS